MEEKKGLLGISKRIWLQLFFSGFGLCILFR